MIRAQNTTPVYLGLGSNLGDRLAHLRRALLALSLHPEIAVVQVSPVVESEFVGDGEQPSYLNICAEIRTSLRPRVLLSVLKGIEARHGRPAGGHLLPRPLDLDIIMYGDLVSRDPQLTVPHPRARQRAFVLEPLAAIAPDAVFADSCETVAAACAKMRRSAGPWVRSWDRSASPAVSATGNKEEWRAALAVHCR